MKISFILPGSGRSGGVKVAVQMGNALLKRKHDVRLIVKTNGKGLKPSLRVWWLRTLYPQGSSWFPLFKGTIERFSDLSRCRFEPKEVVIAHGWWAGGQLRQVRQNGVTKVHYIHGALNDKNMMKEAWGEEVPKIVVASYLEGMVAKILGQKTIATIPNGIDTSEYYPSVPEGQRDGVGTIFGKGYHKDPETILGVLQALCKSCPEAQQRVFGACRRPKEIPRRMYYRLPSMRKARQIYSRSLVWFLASSSEGFAIPILEAMACGCAVVATDCGGPRDIITDGVNGFLVEVGNIQQIVDRVKLLLDNAELRGRFVRKCRDTVNKFSWDSSINKLEEVLTNLHGATVKTR